MSSKHRKEVVIVIKRIMVALAAIATALTFAAGPASAQGSLNMVDQSGTASETQASLDAKYLANPTGNCTNVINAQHNPNGITEVESVTNSTTRNVVFFDAANCANGADSVLVAAGQANPNLRFFLGGDAAISYRVIS